MKKRQGKSPESVGCRTHDPIDHLRESIARLKASAARAVAREEQEACGREAARGVVRFLRTVPLWVGSGAVFRLAGLMDGLTPSEAEAGFWLGFFSILERAIRGF